MVKWALDGLEGLQAPYLTTSSDLGGRHSSTVGVITNVQAWAALALAMRSEHPSIVGLVKKYRKGPVLILLRYSLWLLLSRLSDACFTRRALTRFVKSADHASSQMQTCSILNWNHRVGSTIRIWVSSRPFLARPTYSYSYLLINKDLLT